MNLNLLQTIFTAILGVIGFLSYFLINQLGCHADVASGLAVCSAANLPAWLPTTWVPIFVAIIGFLPWVKLAIGWFEGKLFAPTVVASVAPTTPAAP